MTPINIFRLNRSITVCILWRIPAGYFFWGTRDGQEAIVTFGAGRYADGRWYTINYNRRRAI